MMMMICETEGGGEIQLQQAIDADMLQYHDSLSEGGWMLRAQTLPCQL